MKPSNDSSEPTLAPPRLRPDDGGARGRRSSAWAALVAAPAFVVAADVCVRPMKLASFGLADWACYVGSLALASPFWVSLGILVAGARGTGRAVSIVTLAAAALVSVGAQAYFYRQYATYINLDAALFGASFGATVGHQLVRDLPSIARSLAPVAVAAFGLAGLLRRVRYAPSRRARSLARALAAPALVVAALAPCSSRTVQAAPPDVLLWNACGGLLGARLGLLSVPEQVLPGRRAPEYVPALDPRPPFARNVVFVLTESVRSDAACSSFEPDCRMTPAANRAVPERMPLTQMRAVDSTTAVSLAVLMTGLSPASPRELMHAAPTAWEFAHAAGWDTAYFTSQNLSFGNSDLFVRDIATNHRVSGTDLEPDADLEMGADDLTLAAHVTRELPALREPFFAVVQFSNTHFPYWVGDDATFAPASDAKDPAHKREFYNYYLNSVHRQDAAIGALLEAVRRSPAGARTVVVFTSDHGEAFFEHGQTGHTLSVYDEEVHVPAWVDAPPGTLSEGEHAALVAARDRPVLHTDVLPTLLDLMGLNDAPELGRFRARFAGASLLRPPRPDADVPMTNCAAVWGCPFRNWGIIRGARKLEARAWDADWHCFDLASDPGETRDLGAGACGGLRASALATFGALPSAAR